MERLNNSGKRSPFTVPENYFGELYAQLDEKLGREKVGGKTRRIYAARRIILSAAATVGIAVISYFGIRYLAGSRDDLLLPALSEYTELLSYDLDEYLLVEELSSDEVVDISPEISDLDIVEYLIDNDIDYYAIIKSIN